MSATTELLLEQIEELKLTILSEEIKGHDVSKMKENLILLQKKLNAASVALNENKQVLKG